ncbi:D-alanyl-D-alanine carboxypeptidase/D-alanyl-D-alanine-endopeptidase [Spongiactinospora sp. TRM90649]|uniref:D-alanyl-D-alanine carboxypeptidase/D-alanyl-D-alanine endopeptidase n=1 Tax=Spongiactinospora sp. TRM90649 TaxID=3031114 RepID=UPI0023F84FDB|nr:D-alanyl-D-alanine carboxypeptidase/D-alanyl-D-alanine-endopeptidase [Spongiactinospora sp. TRM90649]MDF5758907.1 D-alanyl-D-alanine carboxypeptidase/D-alanyl-D-alanine-endopeptidase [Spongiactinospora sp. TRM90649]
MIRRERWTTVVTLGLLQVFVIVAGVHVVTNDVNLGALTSPPRPAPPAEPPFVPVKTAGPVLAAGGNGPLPVKGTLAGRLTDALGDPALGDSVGAVVVDASTGAVLYGSRADIGITPASTTKLVTSVSALASLGPDERLATKVVGGPAKNAIVLVGGGDPTLLGPKAPKSPPYPRQASLAQLAQRTAKELKAAGVAKVSLGYDDSLFTGPRTAPGWKPGYIPEGSVAPVTALAIDEGRSAPESRARVADPPRTAALAFARLLKRYGVTASPSVKRVKASKEARELARVESAPVYALVERALTTSDNDLSEALARHVAIKEGRPASFAGVAQAVPAVLARLKAAKGVSVHDGSGLSTKNRISPAGLARLLGVAASPDNPHLHGVVSGMPVAGFSGTLGGRFAKKDSEPGVGLVRAKTGTLNGVNTLAGLVTTTDGRLVAFAFMADDVPAGWGKAEAALDRLAAIVSRCGC